jgi:aerobic carbon-monoxide dehydrogenase small subunit
MSSHPGTFMPAPAIAAISYRSWRGAPWRKPLRGRVLWLHKELDHKNWTTNVVAISELWVTFTVKVNGQTVTRTVEPRMLLSDFLRHELELTGTHVGCEHGSCGACTVLMDGQAVRSCIMLAVQSDGHELMTVEGLTMSQQLLHPLQAAFREKHGLQCGYCTAGFLLTILPFLQETPHPTEDEIRDAISGNICRCTGYQNIVEAVKYAAATMSSGNQ